MNQSSAFCRQQEERHRLLATEATLDNSRRIATIAADAWAKEGESAERREKRGGTSTVDPDDAEIMEEFRREEEEELGE